MKQFSDQAIIDSWQKNVQPWVRAIREGEIASRLQVTNQAIIDAVLELKPSSVLDLGCGEGWLVRALLQRGIAAQGVDVIAELITAAQQAGPGCFRQLAYEALSASVFTEKFDAMVCNFSLLGDASVQHVFRQAATLLNPGGALIVQTLHPLADCADDAIAEHYRDGWRAGSWAGFNSEFCDPAPWYFRTIPGWQALFTDNNFAPVLITEPRLPETNRPASIIFRGCRKP